MSVTAAPAQSVHIHLWPRRLPEPVAPDSVPHGQQQAAETPPAAAPKPGPQHAVLSRYIRSIQALYLSVRQLQEANQALQQDLRAKGWAGDEILAFVDRVCKLVLPQSVKPAPAPPTPPAQETANA